MNKMRVPLQDNDMILPIRSDGAPVTLCRAMEVLEVAEDESGLFDGVRAERRAVFPVAGHRGTAWETCSRLGLVTRYADWRRMVRSVRHPRLLRSAEGYAYPAYYGNVRARMVHTSTNLVGLYPQRSAVVKLAFRDKPKCQDCDRIIGELRSSRIFHLPKHILGPTPVSNHGCVMKWEEHIPMRAVGDQEVNQYAMVFLKKLLAWYDYVGVTCAPPAAMLALPETALSIDRLRGWFSRSEIQQIREALRNLAELELRVHFSWIHGDARLHNLGVGQDGGLIVFDWDTLGHNAILNDICLIHAYGGDAVIDCYDAWLATRSDAALMSARTQRFLHRFHMFNRLRGIERRSRERTLTEREQRLIDDARSKLREACA